MARYGASTVIMASLDVDTDTYSNGAVHAKLISVNVTPNFVDSPLYADDGRSEYIKVFKDAGVDLETDTIPLTLAELLFGHKIGTGTGDDKDEETANQDDVSSYVGFGFMGQEIVHGKRQFCAVWLPKVQFSEGEDSYQTVGENLTLSGHKLSGSASSNDAGVWRQRKRFATRAEALAYVKKKANITE